MTTKIPDLTSDSPEPRPDPIPDIAEAALIQFNRGATQGLTPYAQEQTLRVRDEELLYLLIYAKSEQAEAHKLHEALAAELRARGRNWGMLDYHRIPPGEPPAEARAEYLRGAGLAILCLSAKLVADIKGNEPILAGLLNSAKCPLIPLAMKAVTAELLAETLLDGRQVLHDAKHRSWNQRRDREAWCADAAQSIVAHVDAIRRTEGARGKAVVVPDPLAAFTHLRLRHADGYTDRHYVEQHLREQGGAQGRPALSFLFDWLRDPSGSPFCAVFGELGMGKTTLAQRLTRTILGRREREPDLPLPVYLDLRAVNSLDWDWTRGVPSLEVMLNHLLDAAYNISVGQPLPGVDDIKSLAQRSGGLVIFDGLDEVMNRLTPDQCHLFIQRLWSILPPIVWRGRKPSLSEPSDERGWEPAVLETSDDGQVGRLIMTCRSHFFQTLKDQLSALAGRQREGVGPHDYLWVTLLPFGKNQIETYFRQVFATAPSQAERVIAMLDEIHGLRELGTRPYNLRLIQDQVESLEAIHRGGGEVTVADLYEGMVDQWTRRDSPKHRLSRDHKILLMERLARRLWTRQHQDLSYLELQDWLLAELDAEPLWKLAYQAYLNRENGTEILQEDLRNATFLVRKGEDRFRFAHTSIMEFFLARALHRALLEDRLDQWAIPIPSAETLDFLGGLILGRETTTCLRALGRIRSEYRKQVSELALAYALRAYSRELPGAVFAGFRLQGAEFRFARWQAVVGRPMIWRGVDLTAARLDGAQFSGLDMRDSHFDGADLARTLFHHCQLNGVSIRGADLTGAVFHDCQAEGTDFSGSRLFRTQWLGRTREPVPVALNASAPMLFCSGVVERQPEARACGLYGHVERVDQIAFDLHGRWLVSAGEEGSIKLWDSASGSLIATLDGHQGRILALAADATGCWFASAGLDGTIRIWNPDAISLMGTLSGHCGAVNALAVSPDGRWLASAGIDGSVRLWDPVSASPIGNLPGQEGSANVLAADPGGRWLAAAGDDGVVRIWDVASASLIARFTGHRGPLFALAVDPAGRWLASGGADCSVRVWDPTNGAAICVLNGHPGRVRALAAALIITSPTPIKRRPVPTRQAWAHAVVGVAVAVAGRPGPTPTRTAAGGRDQRGVRRRSCRRGGGCDSCG